MDYSLALSVGAMSLLFMNIALWSINVKLGEILEELRRANDG